MEVGSKMRKLLITGGAGFIGSNFTELVSKKNQYSKIIILDKLTYAGGLDNLDELLRNSEIEFLEGDVGDSSVVDYCVNQVDDIVHFAAETHVTKSLFDARDFVLTDVFGTHNLMSAIVRNKHRNIRFVHISTSEVYGTANSDLINENHQLNPLSPYAGAKCGADRLVYSFLQSYNLDGVIIRPFNNYGPRQHLEKLVPRVITSALLNFPITIHGDGNAKRDWVFVEDTVQILSSILDTWNLENETVFNIGTGVSTSVIDLVNLILELIPDSTSSVEFLEDRPGQVRRHTADMSRLRMKLNFPELTELKEGMSKTIKWYLENESWWKKRWDSREIEIILPNGKKVRH